MIERALLALLAGVIGLGGMYAWARNGGKMAERAKWEQREVQARKAHDAELSKQHAEDIELAAEYESNLHDMEGRYAALLKQRRVGGSAPVSCPASGKVGDVVVPAEWIRGLFPFSGVRPPEPAASIPAVAL